MHVLTADRCLRMDGKTIAKTIVEVVGTRRCYITLDVDAIPDPAKGMDLTGGTGTPAIPVASHDICIYPSQCG